MKKAIAPVFVLLFLVFSVQSFCDAAAVTPAAQAAQPSVDKAALLQQLKDVETQIEAVKADLKKLRFQKDTLHDQIEALRTQKHLDTLAKRQQDLNGKLAAEQAKNGRAKATEINTINTRISQVSAEIPLQNEILGLLGKLKDADAAQDSATAKSLRGQIKAKREAIKALYPPKPAVTPAAVNNQAVKPAVTPRPEDADIQALLDQIKPIEDQIKADEEKLQALKAQKDRIKAQLKAAK